MPDADASRGCELVDLLARERSLPPELDDELVRSFSPAPAAYAAERSVAARREVYGDDVFIRGLVEISSCCRNDCLYCGLRRSNRSAERYRLTPETILTCWPKDPKRSLATMGNPTIVDALETKSGSSQPP